MDHQGGADPDQDHGLDNVRHGRQSATSSPLEVKPLPVLDTAEVSRRTGVPASTLRYYDEKGLIRPIGRRGLRRLFDAGVLDRLALIALGRSAGFSLQEIAGMFGPDGRPRIDRAALAARAEALDATIGRLTALREGLRHASACPARNHLECPTFRRLMRLAAGGKLQSPVPLRSSSRAARPRRPRTRR
ncbi:MAG TPA: helix-turn-helix domain-containing protein [Steroidobacteraceae bacterium]|nr:helix-turn-helix domain-containing protein [Steroidobacteraceae bacterium]